MERFAYQYIANEYKDDVEWQKDKIKIFSFDIETSCEEGFPDVDNPIRMSPSFAKALSCLEKISSNE